MEMDLINAIPGDLTLVLLAVVYVLIVAAPWAMSEQPLSSHELKSALFRAVLASALIVVFVVLLPAQFEQLTQ